MVCPEYIYNREWRIGKLTLIAQQRKASSPMGRFGGGWNWKFGFQASGRTVIINYLVGYLRIKWEK